MATTAQTSRAQQLSGLKYVCANWFSHIGKEINRHCTANKSISRIIFVVHFWLPLYILSTYNFIFSPLFSSSQASMSYEGFDLYAIGRQIAWPMIICGTILFIIAFLGCCGANCESRLFLMLVSVHSLLRHHGVSNRDFRFLYFIIFTDSFDLRFCAFNSENLPR